MAKKKGITKTKAVLDYWNQHPKATAAQVAEAMKREGIEVTVNYIYNIRRQSRKKGSKKAVARKAGKTKTQTTDAQERAAAPVAPAAEKREPAGTITLEHIKAVAQTIKGMGGFGKLNELVSLIREVGGLRKFKDLVDAIAATESDRVPF